MTTREELAALLSAIQVDSKARADEDVVEAVFETTEEDTAWLERVVTNAVLMTALSNFGIPPGEIVLDDDLGLLLVGCISRGFTLGLLMGRKHEAAKALREHLEGK